MIRLFLWFRKKGNQAQTGEVSLPDHWEDVLFSLQEDNGCVVVLLSFSSFHGSVIIMGVLKHQEPFGCLCPLS